MTRVVRSRRAGRSRDEARQQPLYARMLGLKNLTPSGFLCFVFLEGAIVLGILLALAELVSWWGVLVLPITVAMMVKLNDVVAGMLARPEPPTAPATPVALRRAGTVDLRGSLSIPSLADLDAGTLNGPPASRQWADQLDTRQQWARQAATRRYE
jgi:hypothetical protein